MILTLLKTSLVYLVSMLDLVLLLGDLGHLPEHDERVAVHSSQTPEGLARIIRVAADLHLGLEGHLGLVAGLDKLRALDLLVVGGLAHLPGDVDHAARRLGGPDVAVWRESSLVPASLLVWEGRLQLSGVVLHEYQGVEEVDGLGLDVFALFRLLVHDVTGTGHVVLGQSLGVDADVVAWSGHGHTLVVHLDGERLSIAASWAELYNRPGLQRALLDTARDHITDTLDLVDTRARHPERLVHRSLWRLHNVLQSVVQGPALDLLLLDLDRPSLVPVHVGRLLLEVVALPAAHRDERDLLRLVADLGKHFLDLC